MSRKVVVARLENILRKEKRNSREQSFEPMSQDELYKRIDRSESDFRTKRYKSSSVLLAKYNR